MTEWRGDPEPATLQLQVPTTGSGARTGSTAAGARPLGLIHSRSRDRSADCKVGAAPAGKCSPWWRGNTPAHGGERVSRPVGGSGSECPELKIGTAGRGYLRWLGTQRGKWEQEHPCDRGGAEGWTERRVELGHWRGEEGGVRRAALPLPPWGGTQCFPPSSRGLAGGKSIWRAF